MATASDNADFTVKDTETSENIKVETDVEEKNTTKAKEAETGTKSPETPQENLGKKSNSDDPRADVKQLKKESALAPSMFSVEGLSEEEQKDQEMYKKFRNILHKLKRENFGNLLNEVKNIEINTQKRLEGITDLIFEKAVEEPQSSEIYAAMCKKLSMLKVPADNATSPNQCVNFRALIINKAQNEFETNNKKNDEALKLEKEVNECTDLVKKQELELLLNEEYKRIRLRSLGNIKFIGELYKLRMLTYKIMDYCMKFLIDKWEEDKLECLCKLLTTIGKTIENEESTQLDIVFKKMQEIVNSGSKKISSRVMLMIQDVIALRMRKWSVTVVAWPQPITKSRKRNDEWQGRWGW